MNFPFRINYHFSVSFAGITAFYPCFGETVEQPTALSLLHNVQTCFDILDKHFRTDGEARLIL